MLIQPLTLLLTTSVEEGVREMRSVLGTFLLLGAQLFAAPCVVGSLESYITGGVPCTVGTVEFSDFTTEPGISGSTPIDSANVLVTPGGTPFQPLLLLTLNQTANAGELLDLLFRVQAAGVLTASSIALGSPSVTGDGAVIGILDVCAGGNFSAGPSGCSGTSASALAAATAASNDNSGPVTFPVSSFFDIFYEITLDGGLAGTASLASAALAVDTVPEPSAILLVSLGLAAIGLYRRRHQH